MIVTLSKVELLRAIEPAARIARGAAVDYLSCLLFVAETDGELHVSGTDTDESASCTAMAMVEEPGCMLIPALTLARAVKTLPDAAVTVRDGGRGAVIECGSASFDLPTLDPLDFPAFPDVEGDALEMELSDLSAMISSCTPFASKRDDRQKVFTCIHVASDGERVMLDATDTYRIIRTWRDVAAEMFECCVPVAFLANVASQKCGGKVKLTYSGNQIKAETDAGTWTTRAVEGKFPKLDQFFAGSPLSWAELDMDEMRGASKRAQAVGARTMKLEIGDECEVSVDDAEKGAYMERLAALDHDGGGTVGLDASYLSDALGAVSAERVRVELTGDVKPVRLRVPDADMVIMPVRLDR